MTVPAVRGHGAQETAPGAAWHGGAQAQAGGRDRSGGADVHGEGVGQELWGNCNMFYLGTRTSDLLIKPPQW